MTIKIEKRNCQLTVEYTSSSSKAPLKLTLDPSQAALLISLLQTAVKSEAFTFEFKDG